MNIFSEKDTEDKILTMLDSPVERQKLIDRWRSFLKRSKIMLLIAYSQLILSYCTHGYNFVFSVHNMIAIALVTLGSPVLFYYRNKILMIRLYEKAVMSS